MNSEKMDFLKEHFLYEIKMMFWAYRVYVAPESIEMNIKIETFLTHARALLEFFYDNRRRPDDARAFQFVEDKKKWETERPLKTDEITLAVLRMNKELSHITYRRHAGVAPEKSWTELFPVIKDHLVSVIKIFNKNLPQELIEIESLLGQLN